MRAVVIFILLLIVVLVPSGYYLYKRRQELNKPIVPPEPTPSEPDVPNEPVITNNEVKLMLSGDNLSELKIDNQVIPFGNDWVNGGTVINFTIPSNVKPIIQAYVQNTGGPGMFCGSYSVNGGPQIPLQVVSVADTNGIEKALSDPAQVWGNPWNVLKAVQSDRYWWSADNCMECTNVFTISIPGITN